MRPLLILPLGVFALFLIAAGSPTCPSQQWVATYTSPGFGPDAAFDMGIDGDGNTYLAGTSDGSAITLKYDINGDQVWAQTLSVPGGTGNTNLALIVDDDGNAFVTGGHLAGSTSTMFTVKYNAAGQQQWLARYQAPARTLAAGQDIAIDAAGNVLVLGVTLKESLREPEGFEDIELDFLLVKYTPAGQQTWAKTYDGPAKGFDVPSAMALDAAGNVYVTGLAQTGSEPFIDEFELPTTAMVTLKFTPTGALAWSKQVASSEGPVFAFGADIAVDGLGNVVATGSDGEGQAVIKYGPTGSTLWQLRGSGSPAGGGIDLFGGLGAAIAIDDQNNVHIAGAVVDGYVVQKFSAAGQPVWTTTTPVEGFFSFPFPAGIALDAEGNVYMTGDDEITMQTIKFAAADGKQVWSAALGDDDGPFTPVGIAVDEQANVFVGASRGFEDFEDALIAVRYAQGGP